MNRFNADIYSPANSIPQGRQVRSTLVLPDSLIDILLYLESISGYLCRASKNLHFTKSELVEGFVLPRTNLELRLRFLDSS